MRFTKGVVFRVVLIVHESFLPVPTTIFMPSACHEEQVCTNGRIDDEQKEDRNGKLPSVPVSSASYPSYW